MRLSELSGKEVINIADGMRLGVIELCELSFDENGQIAAMHLPGRASFTNLFQTDKNITIRWETVRKIGSEVIVVDL